MGACFSAESKSAASKYRAENGGIFDDASSAERALKDPRNAQGVITVATSTELVDRGSIHQESSQQIVLTSSAKPGTANSEHDSCSKPRRQQSDQLAIRSPHQGSFTMLASPITYLTSLISKDAPVAGRGRARRASLPEGLKAELAAIADQSGQLSLTYSMHLSQNSVASVRSDAKGAVIVYEPGLEDEEGPVKLTRLIGKGGCGRVYTGEWNGEVVAVKVAVGYAPEGEDPDEELIAALELKRERMTQLEAVLMSKLTHPNIVRTHRILSCAPGLAAAAGPDDVEAMDKIREEGYTDAEHIPSTYRWYIIMEYAPLGSLWQGLRHGRFHRQVAPHTPMLGWDAWSALEVLKEVANAMLYLTEHNIIHGDLKAANILLLSSQRDRRGYISKITDFGFSRILGDTEINTRSKGTVTHMPPELLQDGRLLPACDTFAYGIMMWELLTAQHVYQGISDSQVILQVVETRLRPSFPTDTPPSYKELSLACTAVLPRDRPSWKQIMARVTAMSTLLCPQGPESGMVLMRRGGKARRASLQTYMLDTPQSQGGQMLQLMHASSPQAVSGRPAGTSPHALSGRPAGTSPTLS